jgi:ketose-bisphosphate aldolase
LAFVTLNEILAECRSDHARPWAVPAFEVINMATVTAVVQGAAAENAPVIVMVYPYHTPVQQWPGLVALIRAEAERVGVPVCLHLDHAGELEQIRAAVELGFSSVMIDASTRPLAENIAITRQAVEEAHPRGVSVEAELGHVGSGDEVLSEAEAASRLTRVEEAEQFISETGVDALAVAVGTAHGLYRGEPNLDFERLRALSDLVPVPLVLHGGSGTPDKDVRRAIEEGISKVNIWTEVRLAFIEELKAGLDGPVESCQLHEALAAAQASAQEVVRQKIHLLGAAGRAV